MASPALIDISGQSFGLLEIHEYLGRGTWRATCACGGTAKVYGPHVRAGQVTSCGCAEKHRAKRMGHWRTVDISDQRFGKLVAKRLVPLEERATGSGGARWVCICDCGTTCSARGSLLRTGQTKSCGCARAVSSEPQPVVVGEVFGQLTAVEMLPSLGSQGVRWRLACTCGGEHVARGKDLRQGTTKSCGCARVAGAHRVNGRFKGEKLPAKPEMKAHQP